MDIILFNLITLYLFFIAPRRAADDYVEGGVRIIGGVKSTLEFETGFLTRSWRHQGQHSAQKWIGASESGDIRASHHILYQQNLRWDRQKMETRIIRNAI